MREQQGHEFQQDTPHPTNVMHEIYTSFIRSRTMWAANWSTKSWMRVCPACEEKWVCLCVCVCMGGGGHHCIQMMDVKHFYDVMMNLCLLLWQVYACVSLQWKAPLKTLKTCSTVFSRAQMWRAHCKARAEHSLPSSALAGTLTRSCWYLELVNSLTHTFQYFFVKMLIYGT